MPLGTEVCVSERGKRDRKHAKLESRSLTLFPYNKISTLCAYEYILRT
jgi:hypothetical protein